MKTIGERKKYWQLYLGVDSFKDYCLIKLGMSDKTIYQIKQTVEFIKQVRPNALTDFEKNIDAVPFYSQLQPLLPFTDEISDSPDKYDDIVNKGFDPEFSRNALKEEVKNIFPSRSIKPIIQDADYDEQIDINTYLDSVEKYIFDHVDENKKPKVSTILSELRITLTE